jgi:hypothetical protein
MTKKRIDEEFQEMFPKLYTDVRCGFCLPKGWKELLIELSKSLEPFLEKHPEMKVEQVKEKFGGLRFYTSGFPEFADELVTEAERKSAETCQVCGEPGTLHGKGWVSTLCGEHSGK